MEKPDEGLGKKSVETTIHPTAIVHKKAELDVGVTIGPFCIVEEQVQIGRETRLVSHVVVHHHVVMGQGNTIHQGSIVGGDPQARVFQGEEDSRLEMGDDNIIRENVTLSRGLANFGGLTKIGSRNRFFSGAHIAHDCQVGDNCIFSNNAALAGHVVVHNHVTCGGLAGVHQFCSIGEHAFVGALTKVVLDIPPYVIADGHRARLFGINKVGLEREKVPADEIRSLQEAYRLFFRSKSTAEKSLAEIEKGLGASLYIQKFVAFIRSSTRGVTR